MQQDIYFRDTTFDLEYAQYDITHGKHAVSYLLAHEFKTYDKMKKSVRSLKNICVYHIMNTGINIAKGQVPHELLEYVIQYKRKHRKLFPTFRTTEISTEKARIKRASKCAYYEGYTYYKDDEYKKSYRVKLRLEEYNKYIILKGDSASGYLLSAYFDKKLNFHVTSYIKRTSTYNYPLRKCPHIDLPFLNGY